MRATWAAVLLVLGTCNAIAMGGTEQWKQPSQPAIEDEIKAFLDEISVLEMEIESLGVSQTMDPEVVDLELKRIIEARKQIYQRRLEIAQLSCKKSGPDLAVLSPLNFDRFVQRIGDNRFACGLTTRNFCLVSLSRSQRREMHDKLGHALRKKCLKRRSRPPSKTSSA